MHRREQEKTITIENRTFKIKKFNPETGCYWALKLFGTMSGSLTGGEDIIAKKIQEFITMQRSDHKELHRDCLSHVFEMLEAGPAPVMNAQGYYGVEGVDAPLAFQLMVHAFSFSIADFFTKELLGSLVSSLQEMGLSVTINESTNSSTSPSSLGTGDNTRSGTEPTPSPIG